MTRLRVTVSAIGLLALLVGGSAAAAPPAVPGADVTVDAAAPGSAAIPQSLSGYAFDARVSSERLRPPTSATYRLDAGLEHLYDCRSGHLSPAALRQLNDQLDTIERLRAEPIVILDYMPACLAATVAGEVRDTRLLPPRSADAWHRVIKELVTALSPGRVASGRGPVRYFEAWNEPDGLFWQGTLAQYVTDVELPAGTAVAEVAASSRLPLLFSVAATTFPDPAWQLPLLQAAVRSGVPVGFVSWHYYANYPVLGPDGGEPGENPAIAAAAGHANPAADPLTFGAGVQLMRETARQALGTVPELVLDEWNLSAGGFDLRNDTYVGAAFQAASLIELADAQLDRALLYASVDVHNVDQAGAPLPVRHGDWGVVDRTGGRKPAWYAQRLFAGLRGQRLAVDAHPQPDVWLAATREGRTVHVLLAAFAAHQEPTAPHRLTVQLVGLRPGRHVVARTRIDATHRGDHAEPMTAITADGAGRATLVVELGDNALDGFDIRG